MTHSFRLLIYLHFYRFHRFISVDFFCTSDISLSLEFVEEMTIDFMQIVRFTDQRVENITFTFLFVLMITVEPVLSGYLAILIRVVQNTRQTQ